MVYFAKFLTNASQRPRETERVTKGRERRIKLTSVDVFIVHQRKQN